MKNKNYPGWESGAKERSRPWRKENAGPKGILAAFHGSKGPHPTFEVTLPKSFVQSPVLQKPSSIIKYNKTK